MVAFCGLILALIGSLLLRVGQVATGSRLKVKNPATAVSASIDRRLTRATRRREIASRFYRTATGFPPAQGDIETARETIHSRYIWPDGAVTRQVAQLLAKRAREASRCGCSSTAQAADRSQSGEAARGSRRSRERFHPVRFSNIARMNNRVTERSSSSTAASATRAATASPTRDRKRAGQEALPRPVSASRVRSCFGCGAFARNGSRRRARCGR